MYQGNFPSVENPGKPNEVIALGVDPGTRHLGWGIVSLDGNRLRHVAHGVIDADPALRLERRLAIIDEELARVIARYRPSVGSVESLFFHRDAQAAAKLGHARGVVLLNLARMNVDVVEYAPAHVKRVVAGKGNATKDQVARMVRALLGLDEPPRSDAADALALAVTHCRRVPIDRAIEQSRGAAPAHPALALLLRARKSPRGRSRRRALPA
jgi:crossover junction endodeoxyribonuclease RuvC